MENAGCMENGTVKSDRKCNTTVYRNQGNKNDR